jgi:hypothetical protein
MQRICLHQQSLGLHPIEEMAQGLNPTASIDGVAALSGSTLRKPIRSVAVERVSSEGSN